MTDELKMLKVILKAELTKIEIKIVIYLLSQKTKTITSSNAEMAEALDLLPSNFLRALKKLEKNQVVGKRNGGLYVRSVNAWKSSK